MAINVGEPFYHVARFYAIDPLTEAETTVSLQIEDVTCTATPEGGSPVSGVYNATYSNPATGLFVFEVTPLVAAKHVIQTVSSGALVAIENGVVDVREGILATPPPTPITSQNITDPNWYVDSVNGNDNNAGTSASYPLKTLAKLSETWKQATFKVNVTLTLIGDFSGEDLLIDGDMGDDVTMRIVGTAVQIASGTLTGYTDRNTAANQQYEVADTGIDFSGYVGERVRITSGAAIEGVAWISKSNPGGGGNTTARTSSFEVYDSGSNLSTHVTPSVGDSYVIESLVKMGTLSVTLVRPGNRYTSSPLKVDNIEFDDSRALNVQVVAGYVNSTIFGCKIQAATIHNKLLSIFACCMTGSTQFFFGTLSFDGCLLLSGGLDLVSTWTTLADTLFENAYVGNLNGLLYLNNVGFFDSASSIAAISSNGTTLEFSGQLYGSNWLGVVIAVYHGLVSLRNGQDPAFTGTAGAQRVAGVNDPAYTRGINATTGTGVVTYLS